MSLALDDLAQVPGETFPTVATLKDRIYRSGAAIPPGTLPPPFPFVQQDVRPAPSMVGAYVFVCVRVHVRVVCVRGVCVCVCV